MKLYTTDEVFIEETEEFPQNYTGMIESDDGTKRWYNNGLFNSVNDLPAIIYANGDKCWYRNNIKHRDNGPAIISADGRISYFVNGEYHRIDGPAYEDSTGIKTYHLFGKLVSKEKMLPEEAMKLLKDLLSLHSQNIS